MVRAGVLVLCCTAAGCASEGKDSASDLPPLVDPELEPFIWPIADRPELPEAPTNAVADDEAAAWLGRFLFFDPRLSGSGQFSCATCHDPAAGFSDGLALSEAAGTTGRHAPSIWNAGHQRWLYWDGRCDSLWCQAAGPLEHPDEMDLSRVDLTKVIQDAPDLRDAYTELFGPLPDVSDEARFVPGARPLPTSPEAPDHIAWTAMDEADQHAVTQVLVDVSKAIATYERTVQTTDTPVDLFVRALATGDRAAAEAALTPTERAGLELFAGEGECVFCHSGWLLSNKEFHNLGLPERTGVDYLDTGRYDGIDALREGEFRGTSRWSDAPGTDAQDQLDRIVQSPEQLGQFRTPSLRNVADHSPYMHGGHFASLAEVVAFYANPSAYEGPGHREELVVARFWDADQQASLVAFLEALSAVDAPESALVSAPETPLP